MRYGIRKTRMARATPTQIEICLATDGQAADISHVICDAIRNVNAKDYPPAEIDRLIRSFSTSRVVEFMQERMTYLALLDGVVVGTGSLQGTEIKSVFVASNHHRRGIGAALMGALERAAVKNGLHELAVFSSLSAIRFYSSLGYAEQRRRFYGDEETAVMVKSIS